MRDESQMNFGMMSTAEQEWKVDQQLDTWGNLETADKGDGNSTGLGFGHHTTIIEKPQVYSHLC